jgi:hypothetical protein
MGELAAMAVYGAAELEVSLRTHGLVSISVWSNLLDPRKVQTAFKLVVVQQVPSWRRCTARWDRNSPVS